MIARVLKSIALVSLVAGFAVGTAFAAAEPATHDKAVAMVKKAVAFIKEQGPAKAYPEITSKTGRFTDHDLYIVVYGLDGKVLAHGQFENLVGTDQSQVQRYLTAKSIDEARALSYDQAMQKAGIVLAGVKQVFAVYGLNMDKALDSVKVETAATTGDAAKVKISYTAFDQPFSTESDLVRVDGKWYGKQAIEQWNKHQQEEAAKAANPATPAIAADKPAENKG